MKDSLGLSKNSLPTRENDVTSNLSKIVASKKDILELQHLKKQMAEHGRVNQTVSMDV